MNFRDFGKYNQFKEQFAGMSPEMKEQMMRMAKEQMKIRIQAFVQKWNRRLHLCLKKEQI